MKKKSKKNARNKNIKSIKGGSNKFRYIEGCPAEGCPAEGCLNDGYLSSNSFDEEYQEFNFGKLEIPKPEDIVEMELMDFYNNYIRQLITVDSVENLDDISIYNAEFKLFANISKQKLAYKLIEAEPEYFKEDTFTMDPCKWDKYNSNNNLENNGYKSLYTKTKFSNEKEPLSADFKRCSVYFLNTNNELIEFTEKNVLNANNENLDKELSNTFIDFLKQNFDAENNKMLKKERGKIIDLLKQNVQNNQSKSKKMFKKITRSFGIRNTTRDTEKLKEKMNQNNSLKRINNSINLHEKNKLIDSNEYKKMANIYKILTRQRFGNDMRMNLWPWIYGGLLNSIKYVTRKKQIIIDELTRNLFAITPIIEITSPDEMMRMGLGNPKDIGIAGYMIWYALKEDGYKIRHILIDIRPKLLELMTELDRKHWYEFESLQYINNVLNNDNIVKELKELSRQIHLTNIRLKEIEQYKYQSQSNLNSLVLSIPSVQHYTGDAPPTATYYNLMDVRENLETAEKLERQLNQDLNNMTNKFNTLNILFEKL